MKALTAVLMFLLVDARLTGTSLRPVNPVAGVKTFNVEISLGGPMGLDAASVPDLWGSIEHAESAKSRLRSVIEKKFEASGIRVDAKAKHTMVVGIWGRPITEAGCESLSAALVEVSFHDETPEDSRSTLTWGRSVLEIMPSRSLDGTLEKVLLRLAGKILERGTKKDD